jgi:hypothetical protein
VGQHGRVRKGVSLISSRLSGYAGAAYLSWTRSMMIWTSAFEQEKSVNYCDSCLIR